MDQQNIAQVQNLYFKAYYPLFTANRVTNTETKIEIDFCMTDAVLFCHMSQRYAHFVKHGGKLFESQDTLANTLGLERKAIIRSIKRLVSVGMITQRTSYESGVKRSYYTVMSLEGNKTFLYETVVRERVETGEIVDGKKKEAVQVKESHKFQIVQNGYAERQTYKPSQSKPQQHLKHSPTPQTAWEDDIEAPF